jgi:hypothetical protein
LGHGIHSLILRVFTHSRLIPVLEVFDLPAPYRPFNPVFQGQLYGDDFTNSSTRQEPLPAIRLPCSIAVFRQAKFSIPVTQETVRCRFGCENYPMKRLFLLICLAIGANVFGAELLVGSPAPDLQAKLMDSPETFQLAQKRGKVVIVNFWATWCAPCKAEMPALQTYLD